MANYGMYWTLVSSTKGANTQKEMWVYTTTDTKKWKFCGGLQAKLGLQSSQPTRLLYEEHHQKQVSAVLPL